jgi:hypothetical protein
METKFGTPEKIEGTARYIKQNRSNAIKDVFDLLVEIITNCDDSYHRLFSKHKRTSDGGSILIEIKAQRKGAPSIIIVRDRAEGMTLETMRKKFKKIGDRTSEEGDRGFMGRGLKDCTELGKIKVESIEDDKYYGCLLTPDLEFIPIMGCGKKANSEIRNELNINKSNGTVVSIEIKSSVRIPQIDTIIRDLPSHYALRDICSKESSSEVLLRNLGADNKTKPILYFPPEGDLIVNKKYLIPNYPQAEFVFKLWKAPEILEDFQGDKFRKSGIIIKGERAIHECSLLYKGFENDDAAKKYFGRIECPYIDVLLNEWDERERLKIEHPNENPSFLLDPNRQYGLNKEHPFTKSLFQIPGEILKELLEEEKKKKEIHKQEITNRDTQLRLDALAEAAGKFLSEQVEEIDEVTTDPPDGELLKRGVLIFPSYFNIAIGEIRTLTFYLSRKTTDNLPSLSNVLFWTDDKNTLSVLDRENKLRKHPTKADTYLCTFRVEGKKVCERVIVKAKCSNYFADAFARVIEKKLDEHNFVLPFEFEHKLYQVKEGSKRNIKVYAKYPEVVSQETTLQITSSDSEALPVIGRCIIKPVVNSNYAVGEILIQGRRLKKESIQVMAKMDELETITRVKIVQKEEGARLKIEIEDEDFGNFRAMWARDRGKPNLLLISGRHDSIKRYLGPGPSFDEQNLPHFRLLLAEIVAESICRKSLELEAKERSWEFNWAALRDDNAIAADVLSRLQKRIKDFVAVAHKVMLKDSEVPT